MSLLSQLSERLDKERTGLADQLIHAGFQTLDDVKVVQAKHATLSRIIDEIKALEKKHLEGDE
jgi:hypothetical protein